MGERNAEFIQHQSARIYRLEKDLHSILSTENSELSRVRQAHKQAEVRADLLNEQLHQCTQTINAQGKTVKKLKDSNYEKDKVITELKQEVNHLRVAAIVPKGITISEELWEDYKFLRKKVKELEEKNPPKPKPTQLLPWQLAVYDLVMKGHKPYDYGMSIESNIKDFRLFDFHMPRRSGKTFLVNYIRESIATQGHSVIHLGSRSPIPSVNSFLGVRKGSIRCLLVDEANITKRELLNYCDYLTSKQLLHQEFFILKVGT